MAYKRIFSLFLIVVGVLLAAAVLRSRALVNDKNSLTYLVVGFDDAAENTDVLFMLNYRTDKNEMRVVQIPRDSYFNFGRGQNKINQYFAFKRADGFSKKESLEKLSNELSRQFDVKFDGYFGISTGAFTTLIDEIGGVRVYAARPLEILDSNGTRLLSLETGENLLDSRQALILVRHRHSYANADLGRLDAQKMFINGFIRTITNDVGCSDFIRLIKKDIGVVVDVSISDVIRLFAKHFDSLKNAKMLFATLPGRAAEYGGVWYYVLNKRATQALLLDTFGSKGFDREGRFINSESKIMMSIYNDNSIEFKIQSADDLKTGAIITENERGKGGLYGIS